MKHTYINDRTMNTKERLVDCDYGTVFKCLSLSTSNVYMKVLLEKYEMRENPNEIPVVNLNTGKVEWIDADFWVIVVYASITINNVYSGYEEDDD